MGTASIAAPLYYGSTILATQNTTPLGTKPSAAGLRASLYAVLGTKRCGDGTVYMHQMSLVLCGVSAKDKDIYVNTDWPRRDHFRCCHFPRLKVLDVILNMCTFC